LHPRPGEGKANTGGSPHETSPTAREVFKVKMGLATDEGEVKKKKKKKNKQDN